MKCHRRRSALGINYTRRAFEVEAIREAIGEHGGSTPADCIATHIFSFVCQQCLRITASGRDKHTHSFVG